MTVAAPARLTTGTCEVWVGRVSETIPHADDLASLISDIEEARIDRLLAQPQRDRALASYGLLRVVLSRYLALDPAAIELDRTCGSCGDPHGRPRLTIGEPLSFSVAHSGDLLVFALAQGQAIGVDVEVARPTDSPPPTEQLLDLALTPGERRRVEILPPAARWRLFLRYWTHKEAILKSLGTGLSISPRAVTLAPPTVDQWGQLLPPQARRTAVWVRPLDVGAGHEAALASSREFDQVVLQPINTVALMTRSVS